MHSGTKVVVDAPDAGIALYIKVNIANLLTSSDLTKKPSVSDRERDDLSIS
jgi:hypothetical protein